MAFLQRQPHGPKAVNGTRGLAATEIRCSRGVNVFPSLVIGRGTVTVRGTPSRRRGHLGSRLAVAPGVINTARQAPLVGALLQPVGPSRHAVRGSENSKTQPQDQQCFSHPRTPGRAASGNPIDSIHGVTASSRPAAPPSAPAHEGTPTGVSPQSWRRASSRSTHLHVTLASGGSPCLVKTQTRRQRHCRVVPLSSRRTAPGECRTS